MLQATIYESHTTFVILSEAKNPHAEEAWLRLLQTATLESQTTFVNLSACLFLSGKFYFLTH